VAEALPPTGFWSYTRSDDHSSNGHLSDLHELLENALQLQIGQRPKVSIFRDKKAIPGGSEWEAEIHKALDRSSFLIPIVTPGFLQSEWCCREVKRFRVREQALGRSNLIFPLYYIDTKNIDPANLDAEVRRLTCALHYTDFRDLRYRDLKSEDVKKRVGELAEHISSALRGQMAEQNVWPVGKRPEPIPPTAADKIKMPLRSNAQPWIAGLLASAAVLAAIALYVAIPLGEMDKPGGGGVAAEKPSFNPMPTGQLQGQPAVVPPKSVTEPPPARYSGVTADSVVSTEQEHRVQLPTLDSPSRSVPEIDVRPKSESEPSRPPISPDSSQRAIVTTVGEHEVFALCGNGGYILGFLLPMSDQPEATISIRRADALDVLGGVTLRLGKTAVLRNGCRVTFMGFSPSDLRTVNLSSEVLAPVQAPQQTTTVNKHE